MIIRPDNWFPVAKLKQVYATGNIADQDPTGMPVSIHCVNATAYAVPWNIQLKDGDLLIEGDLRIQGTLSWG